MFVPRVPCPILSAKHRYRYKLDSAHTSYRILIRD